jgi:hypothetical protein
MSDDFKRLSLMVHALPKIGKSWLAESCPGPVLTIDGEGSTDFLHRKRKILWDPTQPPPTDVDENTNVIVRARGWDDVTLATQWLVSGQHPFRSFAADTLTNLQKKAKLTIAGTFDDTRQWGQLLDKMELVCKQWADLCDHPTNPLFAVVVICQTEIRDTVQRPDVQGGLRRSLGSFYDIIGYMRPRFGDGDVLPTRELVIAPYPGIEAGDRTDVLSGHHFPNGIIPNPDITELLRLLNA